MPNNDFTVPKLRGVFYFEVYIETSKTELVQLENVTCCKLHKTSNVGFKKYLLKNLTPRKFIISECYLQTLGHY